MGARTTLRLAVVVAVLLGSLSLVVWRQSRALETLRQIERVRRDRAVLEAERTELVKRITVMESRSRVARLAQDRLRMRVPAGDELVILPLEGVQEGVRGGPGRRVARSRSDARRPGTRGGGP